MSRIHAWLGQRPAWQRSGLAFLAGVAATLAHAPFQLTILFAFAVTALVWLLDGAARSERRLRTAFGIGWWFGFGHMLTGLYWVVSAFLVDGEAWGPLWGIPLTLALAAAMAVYFGLGCLLAMLAWTNDLRRIPAFALGLFVSEWLRGHLFGGFPWILPGYIWTPGEPVSQLASIFGIYGLSLLTLLVAASPATLADAGLGAGRRFAPALVGALLIGLAWGWGTQRTDSALSVAPGALPIVRVADSGLSQAQKWEGRLDQEWRVLRRYLEATGAAEESRADIIVWPEGAIPTVNFFVLEKQDFLDALAQGLGDRVLITGLSRREAAPEGVLYFNSAAVIDGVSGRPRIGQIYDKNRLVPFGEFIPLWSYISEFNIAPLQRIGAGFEPGAPPVRLILPDAPPASALICYEAIFPGLVPRGDGRPGWIVAVTNDAWFGNGTGPYQHYAMARYRSIEEGLPMARAASGGISAIIDAYGREISATSGGNLSAEAQLPPALVETIFARMGIILLALQLVVIAGLRLLPAPSGWKPSQ